MFRWFCAFVVGAVVSGFALLLLTGRYQQQGPVLMRITDDHGLHAGDVFVLAGWAVAVLAILALVALPPRGVTDRSPER